MGLGRQGPHSTNSNYQQVLTKVMHGGCATPHEIGILLTPGTTDEESLLFDAAHEMRLGNMGRSVQVRGIIEFSNYCRQDCLYCGLRRSNSKLPRYRMSPDQIIETAVRALKVHNFGTFVLQSGEDPGYSADDIAYVIKSLKRLGPAVTLSVGQRPYEDYKLWRQAGADRYLLKFETSNPDYFKELKPTTTLDERLECVYNLRRLGYQVGTGIILGLPDQTRDMVIRDLLLLKQLDPEMVSIGPFIPHPDTPLGKRMPAGQPEPAGLIRDTVRAVAVSRLLVPLAHIPATTALGVIGKGARGWVEWASAYIRNRGAEAGLGARGQPGVWDDPRSLALTCGANVIMPDVTPKRFRDSYEIYPGKTGSDGGEVENAVDKIRAMIEALGMYIDPGKGHSPKPQFAAGN